MVTGIDEINGDESLASLAVVAYQVWNLHAHLGDHHDDLVSRSHQNRSNHQLHCRHRRFRVFISLRLVGHHLMLCYVDLFLKRRVSHLDTFS